jgi:iron-sulfur cluster repair protein YtfE (RIC family)
MMDTLTQPLRNEHEELRPHIERLRQAAEAVGNAPPAVLRDLLDEVYDFLVHHLIPHAQAEDAALYPVVARLMGATEATATMRRDHVEVGRLVDELQALRGQFAERAHDHEEAEALRRVLYGLYAVVKLHFAKEEEVYLPLLEARLTSDEAHTMFEHMEQAATEAKRMIANER